ncbi:ATP-binding cassette domain-containing protein [Pseudahrensia aquimaris]|uniref:ATP-binding cassette domain-containing protein n=1 Tax=Pseudahrensia aquimaris TaxID=744461 RepID=A0ABW3FI15_9HYPH
MASIVAKDASVIFPLVGPDRRFAKPKEGEDIPVGGRILRGRDAGIVAIDKFSIELEDGDRLGIFGHNGSGKSTLLRLLAGIYPPTQGALEIVGSTAGMFSLNLGVNKEATGLENIRFKGLMRGMSHAEINEMIPEVAAFSELGDYLHLPVKTYSSGMVMRLMFATASMLKPDILLLDEWVSAGDGAFRQKADEYLQSMIETSSIVVIASQNDRKLREWSNKLVYLQRGIQGEVPEIPSGKFIPDREKLTGYQRALNNRAFEDALRRVGEVWPVTEAPYEFHFHRGTNFLRLQNLDEAQLEYLKALKIRPESPGLHNLLGKVLYRLGEPEKAFHHIKIALTTSDGAVGDIATIKKVASMANLTDELPTEYFI